MRPFCLSFSLAGSKQPDSFLNKTQWFLPPFLSLSFSWRNTPTGFGKWFHCWAGAEGQTLLFCTALAFPPPLYTDGEINVSQAVEKVNGPPQTKKIKFGNLAVTGVLWLCSDHTGGHCCSLTNCSACLPVGFKLCGDKDEICFVVSDNKNDLNLVDLDVSVSNVFLLSSTVLLSFLLLLKMWLSFATFLQWFAKFSPEGFCGYL